eukprot:m.181568 g.181568  ORF g.181568 m.181568 type:complete len:1198 (-) comp15310_c0_seq1:229-3822(-)
MLSTIRAKETTALAELSSNMPVSRASSGKGRATKKARAKDAESDEDVVSVTDTAKEDAVEDEELPHKAAAKSSKTKGKAAASAASAGMAGSADDIVDMHDMGQVDDEHMAQIEGEFEAEALSQMEVHRADSEAHLCGAVKNLELRNFMNHHHFMVDFGRNVNFIVGVNGSGKSAILTGLTLVLGGQVRSTGRRDFIRDGQDEGELVVTITNEGQDAYKPEEYGKTIKITRTLKKSGTNTWKTSNGQTGKTIKTKASEVQMIAEHFNFQVDNPIAVLNQDMTKKFMQSSTKREKYEFFEKGTSIDLIKSNYQATGNNTFQIGKGIRDQEKGLEMLWKDAEEAEKDYERAKKLENMESEIKKFEEYHSWTFIFELEDKLKATQKQLDIATKDRQKLLDKAELDGEKVDGQKKVAADLQSKSRELENRVKELSKQMHELKAVRKKRMRIETKRKQIQESLSDFKQKQVELNNEIENIKANAESEGEKKMKEQQRLLDKLEGQLTKFEADYKTATDGYYQSREAVEQYKDQLDALASKVQAAKKQTKTALENLKVVQSGSKDRLAAYGKEMMALHKAIQKESSWKGHAPIGPIGLHIEPVDASWSPAIEFCVGASLRSFIVDNNDDRKKLQGIIRRVYSQSFGPSVIEKKAEKSRYVLNDRVDTTRLNPKDALLCEDAIRVDNDQVYNVLVDRSRIHQAVLFKNERKCKDFTDSNPRNLYQGFAYEGPGKKGRFIPSGNPNTKSRFYTDKSNHNSVIGMDMTAMIEVRKAEYDRRVDTERNLVAQEGELRQRFAAEERSLKKFSKERESVDKKRDKVENELNVLRATDVGGVDDVSDHVLKIQEELTQAIEETEQIQKEHETLEQDELQARKAEEPLRIKAEESIKELDACNAEQDELQNKLTQAKENENKYLRRQQRNLKDAQKIKVDMDTYLADVNVQTTALQQQRQAAMDLGMAEPDRADVPKKSVEWFQTKIAKMKKVLATKRGEGEALEKVQQRYHNLREAYQQASHELNQDKLLHQELKKTLASRKKHLRAFQLYVGLKARFNFKSMVKSRSFEGKLHIDHEKREIDILVDTSGKATSSGDHKSDDREYQSVAGLSGGEKSFSNACFVTSMWEAMDCPLRCMDEYDVYMDAMNRTVTTKMLIEIAKQHPHRQFVFLSPLGMKALKSMNETHGVKIISLQDQAARKGQMLMDSFAS